MLTMIDLEWLILFIIPFNDLHKGRAVSASKPTVFSWAIFDALVILMDS
jgi:hypothetical protein